MSPLFLCTIHLQWITLLSPEKLDFEILPHEPPRNKVNALGPTQGEGPRGFSPAGQSQVAPWDGATTQVGSNGQPLAAAAYGTTSHLPLNPDNGLQEYTTRTTGKPDASICHCHSWVWKSWYRQDPGVAHDLFSGTPRVAPAFPQSKFLTQVRSSDALLPQIITALVARVQSWAFAYASWYWFHCTFTEQEQSFCLYSILFVVLSELLCSANLCYWRTMKEIGKGQERMENTIC